jgi:hypothetical protein
MPVMVAGLPNVNITLTQAGAAPFLSVDPHVSNVGYAEGITNFNVSSNMPWTATSNAYWCTITLSGTGNGVLVANFQENPWAGDRTATIVVSAPGIAPIPVTVVQQAAPAFLSVSPATRTVTDPEGYTTFSVSANTHWTFVSDANWCQLTGSGTGIDFLTAIYEQNLTPVIRKANITVTGEGVAEPINVQVIQLPSFVSLDENPENTIQISPNPTSGLFILSGTLEEMRDLKVSIVNAKGKTILTKHCKGSNSYTFDLSQAASGNYFVKVDAAGKTRILKIIVQ